MKPSLPFYQLVVIGSGPGGAEAALLAARHGVPRVLLVEKDNIGGGALRGGMIPMRSLMTSQRDLRRVQRHEDLAEPSGEARKAAGENGPLLDWVNRQRHLVARLSYQLEDELRQAGVQITRGRAQLLGGGRLLIVDDHPAIGFIREVQAQQIILATGAKPGAAEIPEHDRGCQPDVGTSRCFVTLAEAPDSLVIVGGGHVGCEFAAIYNALGARVVLLEKRERLLPEMDAEAGDRLHEEFTGRGIDVRLDCAADVRWNPEPGGAHRVRLPGGEELAAEKVLVARGRVPNVDGLGLKEAGVDYDHSSGIIVNDRLETSAPGISAIGDVNGVCTLASSARAQARVAVENMLGCHQRFFPGETPRCIHTDPAVAAVGISEDQARAASRPIRVASARFRGTAPARERAGLVKLIADPLTRRLLGGMIVAECAPEWIGEFSVALQFDAQTEAFAEVPRANDSFAAAIRACARQMFP